MRIHISTNKFNITGMKMKFLVLIFFAAAHIDPPQQVSKCQPVHNNVTTANTAVSWANLTVTVMGTLLQHRILNILYRYINYA